jgi:hypothetical protein
MATKTPKTETNVPETKTETPTPEITPAKVDLNLERRATLEKDFIEAGVPAEKAAELALKHAPVLWYTPKFNAETMNSICVALRNLDAEMRDAGRPMKETCLTEIHNSIGAPKVVHQMAMKKDGSMKTWTNGNPRYVFTKVGDGTLEEFMTALRESKP